MLAALALAAAVCRAADPQPYAVALAKTGNAEMDQALQDASILLALREKSAVGPFALLARAREDRERFLTALRSFGYYKGKVDIRIDGLPLDDPSLPERIAQAQSDAPMAVAVALQPGPVFHLRRIDIRGDLPAALQAKLGLKEGALALAPEVLAARSRLLDALRDAGYAMAKVEEPEATPIPQDNALDLLFKVHAGAPVALGDITLQGLQSMKPAFVRHRLSVHPGDRFRPSAIETSRQKLAELGVFSSVRTRTAEQLDQTGRLPITFEVSERPLRAVSLNAEYSTDLGVSFGAAWQHRNLFGKGEQLNLGGGVNQLGGTSTEGTGYHVGAGFNKPDFRIVDQSLQADLEAVRQNLEAYDRRAVVGDLLLNRRLGNHWKVGFGFAVEQERITQQETTSDFTLIGLPLTAKYDSSNSLLDPTRGVRAAASLTPTQPFAGPKTAPYVLMQLSGSTYLDLGEPGRSVLALRGILGDVEGALASELPPDKRFYAGGSATVRGYKYQSIGPQFPDGKPQGGTALVAGSLEFRQRILEDYGAAIFLDVGQVSRDGAPFSGTWRLGAGLGVRYYTAIGPIRVDVAVPVNRQAGGDTFELYLGLGQAF